MSADDFDGKLVEFLIYFVRTDHCLGSSWTASRYYIRSTVHCTFCLKARRLILIIVKCEIVLILVMKLYWPTFCCVVVASLCMFCAEEAVFNGRLFWRCEERPDGGAIEFVTIVMIESLRCYFAIFARTGYVALISSWSLPMLVVGAASLHLLWAAIFTTSLMLLCSWMFVGKRGLRMGVRAVMLRRGKNK